MKLKKIAPVNIYNKIGSFPAGKMHPLLASDKLQVKVERCEGWSHYSYTNRKDELVLVLEGEVVLQSGQGELKLSKGDLVVLPTGLTHGPIYGRNALLLIFDEK